MASAIPKRRKHIQLMICLAESCTKVAKALVLHYHFLAKPSDIDEQEWNIDEFLNVHRDGVILKNFIKDKNRKELLFPGPSNHTNINRWDLATLFTVLGLFQNVDRHIKADMHHMRELRNKLSHWGTDEMEDTFFEIDKSKIEHFVDNCCRIICNDSIKKEVTVTLEDIEESESIEKDLHTEFETWKIVDILVKLDTLEKALLDKIEVVNTKVGDIYEIQVQPMSGYYNTIGQYKIVRKGPGKWTFGEIYQVSHPYNERVIYALKKINFATCSEKDKEHCRSEAQQLQGAKHKNIVGYIDSFQEGNALCIVMEFCKGGTLRDYIQRHPGIIKEEQFLVLFKQICEGLKYLHDKGIAHRDVKTTNILLTEDGTIKIADLGLAKVLEQVKNTVKVGSSYVMSPEMLEGQEYTLKTDIWSLGCCMYEIGTKKNIFTASDIHALREQHRSTERMFETAKQLPYCASLQAKFCAMLQPIKDLRPSVGNILAYLKGHSKTHIGAETKHTPLQEPRRKTRKAVGMSKTCPPSIDISSPISQNDSGIGHSKTHIGAQTTPTPVQEPRRKTRQAVGMSKTCPPSIDISSPISQNDSGIDTEASETYDNPEGANGVCPVTVEVKMTQEQKEDHEWVQKFERSILEKLNGNRGLLNEMRNQIRETKREETHDTFLGMARKTLGENVFKECRKQLISLWMYKTELLNANFQMV